MAKKDVDAYKGVDVTGKILVANSGLPAGVTRADLRGESGAAWQSPASYAARHGALGVVLIPDFRALAEWQPQARKRRGPWHRVGRQARRVQAGSGSGHHRLAGARRRRSSTANGSGRPTRLRAANAHKGGEAFALDAKKVLRMAVASRDRAIWHPERGRALAGQ